MAKARSKRGAEVEVEDTREKRKARTQPASSVPAVASGVSGESEGAPNGDLEEPAVVAQSTTPETPPEAVTRPAETPSDQSFLGRSMQTPSFRRMVTSRLLEKMRQVAGPRVVSYFHFGHR